MEDNKKSKKTLDTILTVILSIGVVFSLLLVVFKLTFVKVNIIGTSMNPSIDDGSIGYMVKVNKNSKIKRFDVVVSKYLDVKNYYIIKRVLGLPNEEIDLVNNELFVNGSKVTQNFDFIYATEDFPQTHWTLGENEYLLVGDNRVNTILPVVENISSIIAKNGFSYAKYDINSSKCQGYNDYSFCPIDSVGIKSFNKKN